VSDSLFPHFILPDGRVMHFYLKDVLYEAVFDPLHTPPPKPTTLRHICQEMLPALPDPVQFSATDLPRPYSEMPPPLPVPEPFLKQQRIMRFVLLEDEQWGPIKHVEVEEEEPWDLFKSNWKLRKAETEGKSFYNTAEVMARRLDTLWEQLLKKRNFNSYLKRTLQLSTADINQ
ncbi:unnamed protein product, partial [Symbiodinium sp. KB8]